MSECAIVFSDSQTAVHVTSWTLEWLLGSSLVTLSSHSSLLSQSTVSFPIRKEEAVYIHMPDAVGQVCLIVREITNYICYYYTCSSQNDITFF